MDEHFFVFCQTVPNAIGQFQRDTDMTATKKSDEKQA